mmetsp:Transcript_13568/g.39063  ORF Transcript_13568/g.39063 Transcript_13568/m.39063 type:complete len:206 (-) Transcript_13568:875-1492(-)
MATTSQPAPTEATSSSRIRGSTSSALPAKNVAFSMPFRAAFWRADSHASGTSSTPTTFRQLRAMHKPMVPTPQQTSRTNAFSGLNHWRARSYSSEHVLWLVWKNDRGPISNFRPISGITSLSEPCTWSRGAFGTAASDTASFNCRYTDVTCSSAASSASTNGLVKSGRRSSGRGAICTMTSMSPLVDCLAMTVRQTPVLTPRRRS